MSQYVEAHDAGDLISTLNVIRAFYFESDLVGFPWLSITISCVVWGCPNETYPIYFWLIACCTFKWSALRNPTLSCLTQIVPCHRPCYHYPYKTLHTRSKDSNICSVQVPPCIVGYAVPALSTLQRSPCPISPSLPHRTWKCLWLSDCEKEDRYCVTDKIPQILCPGNACHFLCNLCEDADELTFLSVLKQRGATPSMFACSALCRWFVLLSETFTGCHLSLQGCGRGACWAPMNMSNVVEEKWLPVNVICQCGKCNGKGMDSQFFSESSFLFSPPTIGVFCSSWDFPSSPVTSLVTLVHHQLCAGKVFWPCCPRSFMSSTLPGRWCVPDVSTENLVGLYLSDFLGEMQHTVTGTA